MNTCKQKIHLQSMHQIKYIQPSASFRYHEASQTVCFPLQDTLIFLWHPPSHNQLCCWRTEYYFPLTASRCETGLQGQWPHRKGQGIVPPPGTIAPASASMRMLTGASSSPPTPGSKERPATQNHCLSLHDISSFSTLLSLIYNVGATESIWFCGAAE